MWWWCLTFIGTWIISFLYDFPLEVTAISIDTICDVKQLQIAVFLLLCTVQKHLPQISQTLSSFYFLSTFRHTIIIHKNFSSFFFPNGFSPTPRWCWSEVWIYFNLTFHRITDFYNHHSWENIRKHIYIHDSNLCSELRYLQRKLYHDSSDAVAWCLVHSWFRIEDITTISLGKSGSFLLSLGIIELPNLKTYKKNLKLLTAGNSHQLN